MQKIIVFGGNGQLGQALKSVSINSDEIIFLSSSEGNVLDERKLRAQFSAYRPDVVINCAAYTAVDKAEDEALLAAELNVEAPRNLARICKQFNAILFHVSTDFVFGGTQTGLLAETDLTAPTGVYGQTKLDGELAIQAELEEHLIIRTSWLYSEFGNNFAKTMLRLGKDRDALNVVADQVGTPTYAVDLATAILTIIRQDGPFVYGLYHYSNEGVASWYDFAHEIFDLAGYAVQTNPISTAAYPTRAKRPAYSVLDKAKIKATYPIQVPHWRDSLKICVQRIKEHSPN